jgi:hypothetical protein
MYMSVELSLPSNWLSNLKYIQEPEMSQLWLNTVSMVPGGNHSNPECVAIALKKISSSTEGQKDGDIRRIRTYAGKPQEISNLSP